MRRLRLVLALVTVLVPTALAVPPAAAATAEPMVLDVCPSDYSGFPADAPTLTCGCTPDAVKDGDVLGANPYYWQSSICRAAQHAGILGASGGQVTVAPSASVAVFPGVTRNGIAGRSWRGGSGNQGFQIMAAGADTAAPAASAAIPAPAGGMMLDVCPSDYSGFEGDAPPLTCGCSGDAVKAGDVLGANPYYWQSSVCRAALHAGIVGRQGGNVMVSAASPVPVFPGVTRNGIKGRAWRGGSGNQGFEVAAAAGAAPAVAGSAPVTVTADAMSLDVCPNDYDGFSADAPRLSCGCSAEAVKAGDVFGANPYYWQSSVCRAAFHAGIVGVSGGPIVVTPAPPAPVFPAVLRNGVAGRSWAGGAGNQGFKVAAGAGAAPAAAPTPPAMPAPKPAVDAAGQPIQAPVAQTLKETGQVALYIRFRFNSADLDMSGAPTLMQLRDALVAAPDLRLMLVGHTDAVGGRDYNRDLSLKRAQAVMLWLRDQQIAPQRLSIDGKGFDEPVADNATESGRALNRRVQAIRVQ